MPLRAQGARLTHQTRPLCGVGEDTAGYTATWHGVLIISGPHQHGNATGEDAKAQHAAMPGLPGLSAHSPRCTKLWRTSLARPHAEASQAGATQPFAGENTAGSCR
jgi:hypothetical protein